MLRYNFETISWYYAFLVIEFIKKVFQGNTLKSPISIKVKKKTIITQNVTFKHSYFSLTKNIIFPYFVYFLSSPYRYWWGPIASWARTSISLNGPVLWTKGVTV